VKELHYRLLLENLEVSIYLLCLYMVPVVLISWRLRRFGYCSRIKGTFAFAIIALGAFITAEMHGMAANSSQKQAAVVIAIACAAGSITTFISDILSLAVKKMRRNSFVEGE
jgi:hypothetical protein